MPKQKIEKREKGYCTKHGLFHGHKYPSCMPTQPKKKIEKIRWNKEMLALIGRKGYYPTPRTIKLITDTINELIDAFNALKEKK